LPNQFLVKFNKQSTLWNKNSQKVWVTSESFIKFAQSKRSPIRQKVTRSGHPVFGGKTLVLKFPKIELSFGAELQICFCCKTM
jgi:hypothetical protein